MRIPLSKPTIDEKTKQEILKVLDSGWWGQGPEVFLFEQMFAHWVGAKYAVAVNSCTAGLDLALKAYDIKGGELITTPMTFVADAAVGEWNGMDVTFADIDPETLCIDPEAIVITPETKAIIAVDSHGRLADIKAIKAKFSGLVIEDAAHAMYTPGAGKDADITVWSFQAVKTLPTGDGGMITTNDASIYKKLRSLTWLGIEKTTWDRNKDSKYAWDYDICQQGTKSYMNDLTAVIGIGQLGRLPEMLAKRRMIQSLYNEAFKDIPQIKIPVYSHTVQYYTMQCEDRDGLSEYLANCGITTSVHFKPLHLMTYWKKGQKRPLPVTDEVWLKLLSLPVHDSLTAKEVEGIIFWVKQFYKNK